MDAEADKERAKRRDEFVRAALTGLAAYSGNNVASEAVKLADATIAEVDKLSSPASTQG